MTVKPIQHQIKSRVTEFNWKMFFLLSVCVVTMFALITANGVRFRIETQKYITCLPFTYYLSVEQSLDAGEIKKGDMVYLSANFAPDFFPKDIELLKLIGAGPGDVVSRRGETVFINQEAAGDLLAHQPSYLEDGASLIIEEGHYWLLASSPMALDSRYFGPVESELFLGRGYALF